MASDYIEVPDPRPPSRTALVKVADTRLWQKPFGADQTLAIALYNSGAKGTLDDCLRVAQNAMPYLRDMGWHVASAEAQGV